LKKKTKQNKKFERKKTQDVYESVFPPEKYGDSLETIETTIQKVIEKVFRDDDGLVRSGIYGETMRPFTFADVKRRRNGVGGYSENAAMPRELKGLWLNYEDSVRVNGKYLYGLVDKYSVTKDRQVLDLAKQTFASLYFLWEKTAEKHAYGPGWIPKPYAGLHRLPEMFECSVDQYADLTIGLEKYYRELAGKKEQDIIHRMVLSFADWWADHDYTTSYFGESLWWLRGPHPHGVSFFLYLHTLAWKFDPLPRYQKEFKRCMEHLSNLERLKKDSCVNVLGLSMQNLIRLVILKPRMKSFCMPIIECCTKLILKYARKNEYPFQIKQPAAYYLCLVNSVFPGHDYTEMVNELLGQCRSRSDFYHVRRGQEISDLPPTVTGDDYLDVFYSEEHVCWFNAYWRQQRQKLEK
jgi:hypothetical protein